MCYTVQGNLLFVALANLEAPTFQVVYQSKTLFTALSSRLLIGRELKASQWFALLLLCLGTVLASDTGTEGGKRSTTAPGGESFALGIGACLLAAVLSASCSVYFEVMLKKASCHAPP